MFHIFCLVDGENRSVLCFTAVVIVGGFVSRYKSTMGWGGSQLWDNNEGVSCCVPYRVTVTSHSPCKAPGRRPGVATDKVSAPRRHARPHFAHSFHHRNFDKRMLKISKVEFSILRIVEISYA